MFQFNSLKSSKRLIHAVSTKKEGNMGYEFGDENIVEQNRRKFLMDCGIQPSDCARVYQVHESDIVIVDEPNGIDKRDDIVQADGMITNRKNLYLFMLIADCQAIILWDPISEVLGLIHAGWRGTDLKIAPKAALLMQKRFGSQMANLEAYISPAITKTSYSVTDPVQRQYSEWSSFIEDLPDGTSAIDVIGYTKKQLQDIGLRSDKVYDSGIDTVINDRFFSHYRSTRTEEQEGRFACVVGMQ